MQGNGKKSWMGWLFGTPLTAILLILDLPEYSEKAKRMADLIGSAGVDAIRLLLWIAFFVCLVMTIYYSMVAPRFQRRRVLLARPTEGQNMKEDDKAAKSEPNMQFNVGTAINSPFGNTFNFASPPKRVLSAEQMEILRHAAGKQGNSSLWIRFDAADGEIRALGRQIGEALYRVPGWKTYLQEGMMLEMMPPGVALQVSNEHSDEEVLRVLISAFQAAKIPCKTVRALDGPKEGVLITVGAIE